MTDVSSGPLRRVLYLNTQFGSSTFGCSAAMVGRAVAATAAHCVYDTDTHTWASWATVYYGTVLGTYEGTARAVRYTVHQGYVETVSG